jgi:UDP:flavonoid glycosyltransferase YjiC (YdhE family)
LLTKQGAGLAIEPPEITGATVREGVRRLLTEPGFADRAAALRNEIQAMPAPNEIVGRIEALTAERR